MLGAKDCMDIQSSNKYCPNPRKSLNNPPKLQRKRMRSLLLSIQSIGNLPRALPRKVRVGVTVNQNPLTLNQNPLTTKQRPLTMDQDPLASDQRPLAVNQEGLTTKQRPLTLYQKPLTLNHRPHTVNYRPFTSKQRLNTFNQSILTVKQRVLTVARHALATYRLPEAKGKYKLAVRWRHLPRPKCLLAGRLQSKQFSENSMQPGRLPVLTKI